MAKRHGSTRRVAGAAHGGSGVTAVLQTSVNGNPVYQRAAAPLLLFVVGVLVYLPALKGGFIWDDNYMLWDNPLNYDAGGLRRIWFSFATPDYWPLTSTVFWFNWQWWGKSAFPYHLQTLLLHAGNGVLVWLLLRRLRIAGAWWAALIFAVHPINVPSVAWITELKNTLSTALALLAVLSFVRFSQEGAKDKQRARYYRLALLLFVGSGLAKSALVGLPFVLAGFLWWRDGRVTRAQWRALVPFLVVAIVMAATTMWFQNFNSARDNTALTLPANFGARVAGVGWATWFYVYKLLVPARLLMIYPYWRLTGRNVVEYLPLFALIACGAMFWRFRRTWGRHALLAGGAFMLLVGPTMGLVNMSYMMHSLVADHFLYLPMVPLTAAFVVVPAGLVGRLDARHRWLPVLAAVIVVTGLGGMTASRAWVMRAHEPLWQDTIRHNPDAWMAYYHLGTEVAVRGEALEKQGRAVDAKALYQESAGWFEKGAALQPKYADTLNNLGLVTARLGRVEEAISWYRKALVWKPDDLNTNFNLGLALRSRGENLEALQRFERAFVVSGHTQLKALQGMTEILLPLGRGKDALEWAARAVATNPNDPQALKVEADLMIQSQQWDAATERYLRLVDAMPTDAPVLVNLGYLLIQKRQFDKAITYLRRAVEIDPTSAGAHDNLGVAHENLGQWAEAVRHYQRLVQLKPEGVEGRNSLARAQDKLRTGAAR